MVIETPRIGLPDIDSEEDSGPLRETSSFVCLLNPTQPRSNGAVLKSLTRGLATICYLAMLMCLCGLAPADAQSPNVFIWNATRGGSSVSYVGDTWRLSIWRAPAYQPVWVVANGAGPVYVGETNASGEYTLSGSMSSQEVGVWIETWSVGPENEQIDAVPNLYFEVRELPTEPCYLAPLTVSPSHLSVTDIISGWSYYILYSTGTTSGSASTNLSPAGRCQIVSAQWGSNDGLISLSYIEQDESSAAIHVQDSGCGWSRPCFVYDPPNSYPLLGFAWFYVQSWDSILQQFDSTTDQMSIWIDYFIW